MERDVKGDFSMQEWQWVGFFVLALAEEKHGKNSKFDMGNFHIQPTSDTDRVSVPFKWLKNRKNKKSIKFP